MRAWRLPWPRFVDGWACERGERSESRSYANTSHVISVKIIVPRALSFVVDRAIQTCGATGLSEDFPLASFYAGARALRLADGPDEVHLAQIGVAEVKRQLRSGSKL